MRISPVLSVFFTSVFFWALAVATSPDHDFPEVEAVELEMTAEVADSHLVLTNSDTLHIANAALQLSHLTQNNGMKFYNLRDYALPVGTTEAIPLVRFVSDEDGATYPIDSLPFQFRLEFFVRNDKEAFFIKDF